LLYLHLNFFYMVRNYQALSMTKCFSTICFDTPKTFALTWDHPSRGDQSEDGVVDLQLHSNTFREKWSISPCLEMKPSQIIDLQTSMDLVPTSPVHHEAMKAAVKMFRSPWFAPHVSRATMELAMKLILQLYTDCGWEKTMSDRMIAVARRNCHTATGLWSNSLRSIKFFIEEGIFFDPARSAVHTGVSCAILAIKAMPHKDMRYDEIIMLHRMQAIGWSSEENSTGNLVDWTIFEALEFNINTNQLIVGYFEQAGLFQRFQTDTQKDLIHTLICASYYETLINTMGDMSPYMKGDRRYVAAAVFYQTLRMDKLKRVDDDSMDDDSMQVYTQHTLGSNVTQRVHDVDFEIISETMKACCSMGLIGDDLVASRNLTETILKIADTLESHWHEVGGFTNSYRLDQRGGVGLRFSDDVHDTWH
jgi:hypothetical protein